MDTSRSHWFLRGMMVGILLTGALNAASYFFRSERLGDLLGSSPWRAESLGFPMQLWEKGNSYGGYFVDYPALLVNATCAAALGTALGTAAILFHTRLNRLVARFASPAAAQQGNLQFSLRGLMLTTAVAALMAAVARQLLAGRSEVLGAVYLFGPWILVGIALLPRRIAWQQRVVFLIPMTLLMVVSAIVVGATLTPPVPFDKVLTGIFVCWTPQAVVAATGISLLVVTFAGRPSG